jgi:HPt (histidine-containing phosphotransfer) domain-containing protein
LTLDCLPRTRGGKAMPLPPDPGIQTLHLRKTGPGLKLHGRIRPHVAKGFAKPADTSLPNMSDPRNPDVLDSARFEMLENSIGPALRPIVARYITDCEAAIEALQLSVAAADHDRVRSVAHRMKGASSSLGLGRMERGFSELELAATQRHEFQAETVAKLSGDLRDAVHALRLRGCD